MEQLPMRSSLELNQSQVPFHAVELEDWMGSGSCLDRTMQCTSINLVTFILKKVRIQIYV